MTTYSTTCQLPLPENTDLLVAETAFGNFAQALDSQLVPQYASTAARDSAMASGKTKGMMCAVAGELQYWDGSQWWFASDARYVVKGADTSRISTITVTDDPHLVVTLPTAGYYKLDLVCSLLSTVNTQGFRMKWATASANATVISSLNIGATATSTPSIGDTPVHPRPVIGSAEQIWGVSASATPTLFMSTVIVQATAADSVKLQWAQGTSVATNLTLQQRSYIKYRRFA